MSRPFQIEISESQEELEKALKYATSASSKERLQMLYWLKSGQVSSRQALAKRLGRDEATITRRLAKVQRWRTFKLRVSARSNKSTWLSIILRIIAIKLRIKLHYWD